MIKLPILLFAAGIVASMCIGGYGNDKVPLGAQKDVGVKSVVSPLVTTIDSSPMVDRYTMFSENQKKFLKTLIVTNAIYAAGFGLYHGVVIPREKKTNGETEELKLMPLAILSQAMMYATVPMSVVASRRAEKNYELYYKKGPRNLTFPLLFIGGGAFLGAAVFSYVILVNDIRDNHEMDNSYKKYVRPAVLCQEAGFILSVGTSLYSLLYTAMLGHKAKSKVSLVNAIELSSWYCNGANGMVMSWNF